MLEITYAQMLIFITLLWIIIRLCVIIKEYKKTELKPSAKAIIGRELLLLLVYVCIIVIARIVYFPWHHVNGHIGRLKLDFSKIRPLRINLKPIVRLNDKYSGWQMNIIGNITMFIPVGIVWPVCYKSLNRLWKTVLAGFCFSLLIEISQLFFYERSTDIDDLLLNTAGVFIGAVIYFTIKKLIKSK